MLIVCTHYAVSSAEPPDITEPPSEMIGEYWDSTTFTCRAVGNGTLNITWRLPSGDIVYTGQDMENSWSVSSSLTVENITADDGGYYTCIAQNGVGANEASAVLYVRLYVSEPQIGLNTTTGSFEIITCTIEGFPIDYVWEKLEVDMMTYTEVSTGRDLEFNPVVFGDEGVYRCVASSSELGEQLVSDNITVTGKYTEQYRNTTHITLPHSMHYL